MRSAIEIGLILLPAALCFFAGYRWRVLGLLAGTALVIVLAAMGVGLFKAMQSSGSFQGVWASDVELRAVFACVVSFAAGLVGAILKYVKTAGPSLPPSLATYRESNSGIRIFGKAMFYVFLVMLFIGALVINLPGIYGPLLVIAFAGAIIRYNLIARDTLTSYVFSTLGTSMRQNLPLATALELEAASQRGQRRRIMLRIGRWLSEGLPLSQAIRRGFAPCPGYALAMVAAAERIGQAPQAVAAVEGYIERRSRESRRLRPMTPAYVAVVLVVMFLILMALTLFILPKFEDIFRKEFGQELPPLTQAVFAISSNKTVAATGGILVVVLGIMTPWLVYVRFRPRRPDRPYAVSRLADRFAWSTPLLRWFARNDSLLQTVSFLRMALAAGRPVDDAIASAAELDVNIVYRHRLLRWHSQVLKGENIARSARRCRVGEPLAWAFEQQIGPGQTLDALDSLECFYRANYSYVTNLARFILFPLTTLALATCVGLIALGLFMPLRDMIEWMSQRIMP